jgi:hypothetical protein
MKSLVKRRFTFPNCTIQRIACKQNKYTKVGWEISTGKDKFKRIVCNLLWNNTDLSNASMLP